MALSSEIAKRRQELAQAGHTTICFDTGGGKMLQCFVLPSSVWLSLPMVADGTDLQQTGILWISENILFGISSDIPDEAWPFVARAEFQLLTNSNVFQIVVNEVFDLKNAGHQPDDVKTYLTAQWTAANKWIEHSQRKGGDAAMRMRWGTFSQHLFQFYSSL